MNLETKVGIFVVIGFLMFFGLTTQVGNLNFNKKEGYSINAIIKDANGLEKNAKVKARGIVIGYIKDFKLVKNGVLVELEIEKDIKIPKDSVVMIKQESMLGVKYIEIDFSNNDEILPIKGTLTTNKTYASFDETSDSINQAAIKFDKFINRLDKLIARNEKNFDELMSNFKDVSADLKLTTKTINNKLPKILDKFHSVGVEFEKIGKTTNKKLPSILDKFESIGTEFNQTGVTINKKLPTIMDKFENIENSVQAILDENRKTLKSAIKNVDSAFEGVDKAAKKVESSFDKLDKYLASTTKSTLEVEMKAQSMSKDHYTKTHFNLDYSPKPTIHYLVDVVGSDDYRDDGTNHPKTTKLHEKGRYLISAQYAKDFDNLRIRGGIIESTGGVGIDYFMLNRNLKLALEAYDFNAYNDVRGDKAHLNTYLEYTLKKHILLYTGYDNFINKDDRTIYFGLGVKFMDEDLKYLLGSSASSLAK
jgi:phospholipid/cholesterol/gamma-HCH transport system substrate-binding protein